MDLNSNEFSSPTMDVNDSLVEKIDHKIASVTAKLELLQSFEKDIEEIAMWLSAAGGLLDEAEDREMPRDWLDRLQEAVYDAEDVLDTFQTEASLWQRKQYKVRARGSQPCITAREISYLFDSQRKIKQVLRGIDAMEKEKDNFGLGLDQIIGKLGESSRRKTSSSFQVEEYNSDHLIVGRKEEKIQIVNRLLPQGSNEQPVGVGFSVLPIIGMAGVGKTTLARLVYNDDEVKKGFDLRMWACVTHNLEFNEILRDMMVHNDHETTNYMDPVNSILSDDHVQLESCLVEFLKSKRFLLVLDDVWTLDLGSWEKLKRILAHGGGGSKVLITSRNTGILEVMGAYLSPYYLDSLSKEHSWSLFNICTLMDSERKELESIGREIVQKCNGLPQAILTVGEFLRGNDDVQIWRGVLREATPFFLIPTLKLNYDHLPFHLKRCFAYCSLFPRAHLFHELELAKFWKAAFIQPDQGLGPVHDKPGCRYSKELLSSSLFQPSKYGSRVYEMHDFMYDLAQSVSGPYCLQVNNDREASNISENVLHISLLCNNAQKPMLQVLQKCNKLRTLISPCGYSTAFRKTINKIFRNCKYLRVLDLRSSPITELPKRVDKKLKLLRYLDLSNTGIEKLPNSICNLYHLQTLKLLGCHNLLKLPRNLGNLANLQHLELDNKFWDLLEILPPRVGRLTKLQNLHAFPVGHRNGYGIGELKNMLHLEGRLHISKLENAVDAREANLLQKSMLAKVVYQWSRRESNPQAAKVDEETLEELQPHSHTKEIHIFNYQGHRVPSWISDCNNLEILKISNCPNLTNLPPGLLGLTTLKDIHIEGCPGLQSLSQEWNPSSLQHLTIDDGCRHFPWRQSANVQASDSEIDLFDSSTSQSSLHEEHPMESVGGEEAAESSGPSRVTIFRSEYLWRRHFSSSKQANKLMVVHFTASWCRPSKMVEPAFNDMSTRHTDVEFIKIDVEELPDVEEEFNVNIMPMFVLLKQGKELERMTGSRVVVEELEKKILQHKGVPKFAA